MYNKIFQMNNIFSSEVVEDVERVVVDVGGTRVLVLLRVLLEVPSVAVVAHLGQDGRLFVGHAEQERERGEEG